MSLGLPWCVETAGLGSLVRMGEGRTWCVLSFEVSLVQVCEGPMVAQVEFDGCQRQRKQTQMDACTH